MFKTFLFLSPPAVPPLDAAAMPQLAQTVSVTSAGSGADWIDDHLPKRAGPEHKSAAAQESPFDQSSWILDFTAPPAIPIEFSKDLLRLRATCWACILVSFASALLLWSTFSFAVAGFGIAIVGILLRRAYTARPELRAFAASRSEIRHVAEELRLCSEEIQRFEVTRQQLRADEADQKKKIESSRTSLLSEQQKSEKQIRDRHATVVGPLQRRLQEASANEIAELTALQKGLGAKVTDLQNRLAANVQAETSELTSRLKGIQDTYVQAVLSKAWIATSQISGIGAAYKSRLQAHGFRTAADVGYYAVQRVPGIGATRAAALANWRLDLENAAKQRMPKQLSHAEAVQINQKYASLKRGLADELQRNQQQLILSQESIRQKYAAIKAPLQSAISSDEATLQRELGVVVADFRSRQAKLSDEYAQATAKGGAAVARVAKEMSLCTRNMAAVQWKKGKLDREHQRYRHLTFRHFLKRAMVGR